jgi:hypothetical protein
MVRILENRHIRNYVTELAVSEDTGQYQTEEAGKEDVHRVLLYTGEQHYVSSSDFPIKD